ncbi:sulfite exporter TauE/SafE family protein [Riemerella anatipestifer]|uniref:sulfite exporter TauE/SafE family protein n=1 Tax=Riemerella anatipestifer TaxID=34085 RepID=UPI0012AE146B|nr:sulfite exporter TauE/SafE family protein [Riemerella anatipestifer]USL95920.1 sulfite exporter TauE/SafE family protein [Riemerella anatipestifer]
MELLGYFFAVIIGLVLGLMGGGGSILSVPVFAYLFGLDAVTSTTLSLFVVACNGLVGSLGHFKEKQIHLNTALLFGIPSVLGVLFSRRVVVPHLPEYIINRWGICLTKDMFLLILFASLMLLASYKMIVGSKAEPHTLTASPARNMMLISQGLLVGIITGLVGAGGGFLIIPALVMILGLKMKEAIGTSLLIITLSSTIGFISSLDKVAIDWQFLLSFTGLSILGVLLGLALSKRVDGKKLKPAFGWFVLGMGVYILIKELILK